VTKLNEAERKSLHDASAAAEKHTSARIAVVTVPISDHYRLYPLVYGGLVLIVVLSVLALAFPHLPLRSGVAWAGLAAVVVVALCEITVLRLMLVPRHAKLWECWELAHRAFASRVLAQNDRKTGICLFVSFGERYIEVVTDRDVDRHIPQSEWDAIIKAFLAEAKAGRAGEALPKAVAACAAVLAPHYPPA